MKSVITRCEECNIPGFQRIDDVEAKATNMYNTKVRHGGQIMKDTLPTQAQTKLQGGEIMHQPLALRKWELLCEQLAF